MKIKLLILNKTKSKWLLEGVEEYVGRINRYIKFEECLISPARNKSMDRHVVLEDEASRIIPVFKKDDYVVLLDESGMECSSLQFSDWLNRKLVSLQGDLVFVVGGAFGFHDSVRSLAREQLSLSRMTFTHQMVRIVFTEQLYRAFTILKNEPYHHS